MKKNLSCGFLAVLGTLLLLAGCPVDSGTTIRELKAGAGDTSSDRLDITKKNVNGEPVFQYLYVEVNNVDPRVAMGYVLDDSKKTPFFDAVVLFAANLRDRDCSAEASNDHTCTKTGLHLHFNGNVAHILRNRNKYLKPLQDKGIKVILGLLEDHDGVGFGTLGEWPFEATAPATSYAKWSGGYPYGPAARTKFLKEVAEAVKEYGLDGVDFDDEWGSKSNNKYEHIWENATYYGSNLGQQRTESGRIFGECAAELRTLLGPDKIIIVYDYRMGGYLPETITFNNVTKPAKEWINYASESVYGMWQGHYTNGENVFPDSQYDPMGCDLGGDRNDTAQRVRPGYGQIENWAQQHVDGNYGVKMYYNLLNRGRYDGSFTQQSNGDNATNRSMFFNDPPGDTDPQKKMPETYLGVIAQTIFGYRVEYTGEDYPQDWTKY